MDYMNELSTEIKCRKALEELEADMETMNPGSEGDRYFEAFFLAERLRKLLNNNPKKT